MKIIVLYNKEGCLTVATFAFVILGNPIYYNTQFD